MIQRCNNKNIPMYKNYGGRGIKVCDEWLKSFKSFYSAMGDRPSKLHTIERRNNDGGYNPENCVWATRTDQQNNTRSNRMVYYEGEYITAAVLARKTGADYKTVVRRLNVGYDVSCAIKKEFNPVMGKRLTYNGSTKTTRQWAEFLGVGKDTLRILIQKEGKDVALGRDYSSSKYRIFNDGEYEEKINMLTEKAEKMKVDQSGKGNRFNVISGGRIRDLREKECIKQEDFAKLIGCNRTTLANIESGLININSARLRVMCMIFEISSDYILGIGEAGRIS